MRNYMDKSFKLGSVWGRSCVITAVYLAGFLADDVQAQVGIASKYVGDQGIENDAAVIFAENFESSLTNFRSRFNGWQGDPSAIATSTDRPSASGGTQSAMLLPKSSSGTLYRQLSADYQQLYMRYYIKYGGTVSHHSGGYLGGYSPPSSWPQGDAGIKGIRPNGNRLFIASLEPAGSPDGVQPNTRLDTYMNWVDMQGQGWNGLWYGRNVLSSYSIPIQPGVWQCVELMIKVNTTASGHEGELSIWINGKLIENFRSGSPIGRYDSVSGSWTTTSSGTPFPGFQWRDVLNYGINWIKLQNFIDVGTPTNVLVDDLVVATQYIGPIHTSGVDTTPPFAPSGLRILP